MGTALRSWPARRSEVAICDPQSLAGRGLRLVLSIWHAHGQMQTCRARKPFPLLEQLPASLRHVTLDFLWSQDRLWALDLPVEHVAIEELRWHLALPMWSFEGVPFTVSPNEVRHDTRRYHAQYARTIAADLAFPLDALEGPNSTRRLLDGVHRLLKADLLGHTTVAVKTLPNAAVDVIAA